MGILYRLVVSKQEEARKKDVPKKKEEESHDRSPSSQDVRSNPAVHSSGKEL